MTRLTVSGFSCDDIGRFRRFALASGVSCDNSKLVFLSFGQIRYCSGVLVGRDVTSVGPVWTSFLFLLDDVASNRRATIVLRWCPFQVNVILIPICDGRFAGSTRLI
jgi:hypothetical protein